MAAESRRGGRRPGASSAREEIFAAACASFAEHGYDRATIRDVAARAGVDPALVIHYFSSKESLFTEVIHLPLRPGEILARGAANGMDTIGATVVRTFLETWEPQETRMRMTATLRSALTNEAAMGMFRDVLVTDVFAPITAALGAPDARLRATLVGSQLVGLAVMRFIARLEPLASASIDELVATVGPTVQRYLMGDLGVGEVVAAGPVDAAGAPAETAAVAGAPPAGPEAAPQM